MHLVQEPKHLVRSFHQPPSLLVCWLSCTRMACCIILAHTSCYLAMSWVLPCACSTSQNNFFFIFLHALSHAQPLDARPTLNFFPNSLCILELNLNFQSNFKSSHKYLNISQVQTKTCSNNLRLKTLSQIKTCYINILHSASLKSVNKVCLNNI